RHQPARRRPSRHAGPAAQRLMPAIEPLVLIGASLIDGTGSEPARGRAVVVEGGRIASVVDEARAPRGRRIDLAGCTLLPGLINCPVHLCFRAEADPVRVAMGWRAGLTACQG